MSRALKAILDKVTDPTKRAALEAELKAVDGLITELDSGYMRQDDYSRKLDEAKVWEEEKKVMEENWVKAKAAYTDLLADYNTTSEERKAAREKLEALEKEYSDHKAKNPPLDPTKVLTLDQYKEQQSQFAAGQAGFFREVLDSQYEIERLTKSRINPSEIVDGALKAGKSPKEFAEEKYKLTELRTKAEEEDRKANEERIRKEEREKVVAEFANPQTRPLQDSKDPFVTVKEGKAIQPWEQTETPEDEKKMLQELTAGRLQ